MGSCIHLPVSEPELYVQIVCSEKLMLCMRANDPFGNEEAIARTAAGKRLSIMFARELHPGLYDTIERKLVKAQLHPYFADKWAILIALAQQAFMQTSENGGPARLPCEW